MGPVTGPVTLSRRLRAGLLDLYRAKFAPGPEVLILDRLEPKNFRHRAWRRICNRAGIGHRRIVSSDFPSSAR